MLSKHSNLAEISRGIQKLKWPFLLITIFFQVCIIVDVATAAEYYNPPNFALVFNIIVGVFILGLAIFYIATGIRVIQFLNKAQSGLGKSHYTQRVQIE